MASSATPAWNVTMSGFLAFAEARRDKRASFRKCEARFDRRSRSSSGMNVNAVNWAVKELIPDIRDIFDEHKVWEWTSKSERGILVMAAVNGRVITIQEDWAVYRFVFRRSSRSVEYLCKFS